MSKPMYAKIWDSLVAFVVVSAFWLPACVHTYRLVPGPGATPAQGTAPAASNHDKGVRITASAQAWNGNPATLTDFVLPIWVQIENKSGKDLWISYSRLQMLGPEGSGVTLRAIPPFKVSGKTIVATTAANPAIEAVGFHVAPYLGPSYTGFGDPWRGIGFATDFEYYVDQASYWEEYLPTPDMIRWAMPEGAVSNGGKVAGFLYFQKLKAGIPSLTLRDQLLDANSREAFGQIDIFFVVVKR